MEFGPQKYYSSQKYVSPGVQISTIQYSKLNNANQVKNVRLEFETKQIRKKCAFSSEPNDLF